MNEMNAEEFLKSQGMNSPEQGSQQNNKEPDKPNINPKWFDLIKLTTVDIILGHKGRGKSGLGYFLLDELGKHYNLTPHVLNLPEDKQYLLPGNYTFGSLEDIEDHPDSIILIDEGTTNLPAGSGLENLVKGYSSMSRQRNQIIIFIFHSSSDVGSRIFRGVDTVMVKEPSKRQIEFGAKDKYCLSLLTEAKDKFKTISAMGEDIRKYTFVDSEEPEFHGIIQNGLPEYWCDDLSNAWGRSKGKSNEVDGPSPTQSELPTGLVDVTGQIEITQSMIGRAIVTENLPGGHVIKVDPIKNVRWVD